MKYCFVCSNCGYKTHFEFASLDVVTAEPGIECPICYNKLRRDYKAEQVNFILTGDGFYSTEHRDTQKDKGSF